jgi:hypothetical protein
MHRFIRVVVFFFILMIFSSKPSLSNVIGKFNADKDLFIAQFDCKTDVDDLHSIAGVATMLADHRIKNVNFHAVAGSYGIQDGLYVPANELFNAAFGNKWSDAHSNYEQAIHEVSALVKKTLENNGKIWIAEAGQSNFSADVIRNIKSMLPQINLKSRINIVQHSNWNENQTKPVDLSFVKSNIAYYKIPDGNVSGNGSPGFVSDSLENWRDFIKETKLLNIWNMAMDIANKYNGKDNRYQNPAIAKGGFDFSDVSETCWIFGFENLENVEQFFKEFSKD